MSEKDINRWQALIQKHPEGPWEMSGPHGSSFDRTVILPISDEMLGELAHWLKMGYTPWNGRSMPLTSKDRELMYLLYFSVQGLIARMRAAEKAAALTGEAQAMLEELGRICSRQGGQLLKDAARDATKLASRIAHGETP